MFALRSISGPRPVRGQSPGQLSPTPIHLCLFVCFNFTIRPSTSPFFFFIVFVCVRACTGGVCICVWVFIYMYVCCCLDVCTNLASRYLIYMSCNEYEIPILSFMQHDIPVPNVPSHSAYHTKVLHSANNIILQTYDYVIY